MKCYVKFQELQERKVNGIQIDSKRFFLHKLKGSRNWSEQLLLLLKLFVSGDSLSEDFT